MPNQSLSIIIVTYYTGDVLFECIASCLKQISDFDGDSSLIIIDNGNDETVRERLKGLSVDDRRVKYIINQKNIGFGAACNIGAKKSIGEVLVFLNPDAVLCENALKEIAKVAIKQIMGGIITDKNNVEQRGARRAVLNLKNALFAFVGKDKFNLNKLPLPSEITEVGNISGAFFAVKRDSFNKINGFDEKYFLHIEDIDLCKRMQFAGGNVVINPQARAIHIGGTSDAPKPIVEYYKFKSFARYFFKYENWAGKFLFILISPFMFIAMMLRSIIKNYRQKH